MDIRKRKQNIKNVKLIILNTFFFCFRKLKRKNKSKKVSDKKKTDTFNIIVKNQQIDQRKRNKQD